MKIFWSWQSDNHQPSGRYFVRDVIASLAAELNEELDTEDAERPENDNEGEGDDSSVSVDHDTLGVGGSPPIADTILRKIRDAAVFVADVTPVANTQAGKRLPNPNVMIELGYALRVLQHERIVLVMNQAEGAALRYLPFDLRHWRAPVSYSLRRDATDETKAEVAEALKNGLRGPITYSLKAANRDWREERRRTHREPNLRVVLDPADAGPWDITQTVDDLGVKSLAEITAETPILPIPSIGRSLGAVLSPSMSPSLASFGYKKPVSQWTREEIEGYNGFVRHYYSQYESYLSDFLEYRRTALRTLLIKLLVVNDGTAPATGIDVDIIFPKEIILYEENKGFPRAPEAPEPPPLMPLGRGQGFARPIRMDMDLERLHVTQVARSTWIYPEERRVHYRVDGLKHNYQVRIEEFPITFSTPLDIKKFEAQYIISANEPRDPFTGVVLFECDLLRD